MQSTAEIDRVAPPRQPQSPPDHTPQPASAPGIEANRPTLLIVSAWAAMLVASILPDIIALQILHNPAALPLITWARVVVLGMATLLSLRWQPLHTLWKYAAILFVFAVSQQTMTWLSESAFWSGVLGNLADPFARSYFGIQFLKLGSVAILLTALFALRFHRRDAYLVRGDLHAPIRPEPWMGFPRPEPWTRFGTMWLFFLGIGMVVILSVFGRLEPSALLSAAPLLPLVVLLAALNAFSEEVTYRSAPLAPLVPAVGMRQAWWLTAVLFGIGHYYGIPYGLIGVLLATLMGWFLAKAMLETRGFFWPWLTHFSQDFIIFWFIAAGSVQPGG
jgi:membrane protease YdiL (CAAX protease family)